MLRISDLEFEIDHAVIDAYCFRDAMQWDVEIQCKSHQLARFHGYKPKLSLSLFETPPNAFGHWTELAPRETDWVEKHDTDITPSGMLYIFEHTPVFECHARYFNIAGKMHVELSGKCDVYFDENYDTNLDLHLHSPLEFRGVLCGRRSEAECIQEIARFLNPYDFHFHKTEHGVSMLIPNN